MYTIKLLDSLLCTSNTSDTSLICTVVFYFFRHFRHVYHSMYYICTVYLWHLQHEIKQRKMNLLFMYTVFIFKSHPSFTKNHLVCKSQIFPIPVTPNSHHQLNVRGLNCDSPGMNCQDIYISQQPNKIIFCCLIEGFNSPLCPPHGALLSDDTTPFPIFICHHRRGREVVLFVELSYHHFLNEPGIIICVHVFLLTPPTCIQLILLYFIHDTFDTFDIRKIINTCIFTKWRPILECIIWSSCGSDGFLSVIEFLGTTSLLFFVQLARDPFVMVQVLASSTSHMECLVSSFLQ